MENYPEVIETWDKSRKGFDCTGVLGNAASIWYPYTSYYAREDGNLYSSEKITIWSSDISHIAEDPVTALTFLGEVDAQEHFALYGATHSSRSCAFPTRCVMQ
ncbi:MAG: hypothetical protein J6Y32_07415 [Bacteroidales bacterium]|nr:hypothetical protein [Bacteroidales bacterium]